MRRVWFAVSVASFALLAGGGNAASAGQAGAAESSIVAGVAVVDITPPIAIALKGIFRSVFSTGTHDPLQAKAIVFRQVGRAGGPVCDLCAINAAVTGSRFAREPKRRPAFRRRTF